MTATPEPPPSEVTPWTRVPRAAAIAAAQQELRAARTLAFDPAETQRLAVVHLSRAYEALARGHLEQRPTTATVAAWLDPQDHAAIPAEHHAQLDRDLPAIVDPRHADPLAMPLGLASSALAVHLDALGRIVDGSAAPVRGLWLRRSALITGLVAVVLVASRPWQGEGSGPWRGAYYKRIDFSGPAVERYDRNLNFDWEGKAPMDEIPANRFSVRWDTCLHIDKPTEVTFQLISDDGSKLYLSGAVIIDNWSTHNVRSRGTTVSLSPGLHHLRVEYFEDKNNALVSLLAAFADEAPTVIPQSRLRAPGPSDTKPCG